jgi:DeoR/GlpR family transcriptional regulator of sugar metabolism
MIGPLATAALDQLRGYMAFVGADGLSMDFGVTAGDIDSAYLYRLAVKNAKESVLLVDRTKFLSPSLIKIVDWEVVSRVVTDQAPPEDWARFLDNKGIQTIFPGCEGREGESNNESIN